MFYINNKTLFEPDKKIMNYSYDVRYIPYNSIFNKQKDPKRESFYNSFFIYKSQSIKK